jgi:CubicO group peptidase (beta-lactamase class C family)
MRMKRSVVFIAASLAFAQDAVEQRVDALFAAYNKPTSPGCALAVVKDGRVLYKHGYGMADLSHDVPMTPQTVIHVGSISKQFTAAAIVLLALDGKLSLDDPVRKYVPELPDYGSPITLRHLIHHTSGLRDHMNLLGLDGWRIGSDLYTEEDVLSVIFRQKGTNFKPGEKHLYNNSGYSLLALIVKRVSGQTLREFSSARIFTPLGMKHTHVRDDHAEIVQNLAYGYSPKGAGFQTANPSYDTVGPTGVLTTVEDFALWDQNFYEPRVGGAAFVRQMLQTGTLNNGREIEYAFGLEVSTYRGLPMVSHSGGDPRYRGDANLFHQNNF